MASRFLIRSAWPTLAVLSGLNMLNYVDRYIMSAVLTPMQRELHLDDAAGGWALSAFMFGYFLLAPVFGYLGDRYPRKYLMLAGVLVWSAATAATALAHNFTQLFLIRVVVGVGEACFVTISPSWISDLFANVRRNTAITLFYVAVPFGSALGFVWGGLFAKAGDWRDAFLWAGLPGVLLALTLLALREPRRGEADGATETRAAPAFREVLHLLGSRRYDLLVSGYAAQTFAIGAFGAWGPTFLNRVHGLPLDHASTFFGGLLAGAGLVATLVGGAIGNVLRRRSASGYTQLMFGSMVLAVPFGWVALAVGNTPLCLVAMGGAMFVLFLPTGPITSEIFEIVPIHLRASAVALCIFLVHLFGDLGSPAAVGYVSEKMHSLASGVLILPAVLAIGAVLWALLLALPAKERT